MFRRHPTAVLHSTGAVPTAPDPAELHSGGRDSGRESCTASDADGIRADAAGPAAESHCSSDEVSMWHSVAQWDLLFFIFCGFLEDSCTYFFLV